MVARLSLDLLQASEPALQLPLFPLPGPRSPNPSLGHSNRLRGEWPRRVAETIKRRLTLLLDFASVLHDLRIQLLVGQMDLMLR
jgi:hypothetical protein